MLCPPNGFFQEEKCLLCDCGALQPELLPQLLRVMDVKLMTGSEGQRKLMLGNATILAYCLRWPEFRVRSVARICPNTDYPALKCCNMLLGPAEWLLIVLQPTAASILRICVWLRGAQAVPLLFVKDTGRREALCFIMRRSLGMAASIFRQFVLRNSRKLLSSVVPTS